MNRRAISVRGIVQGVGFRPFVYHLARRFSLTGFVRNQTDGVWIEVEGEAASLDRFESALAAEPPPLARIDGIRCEPRPLLGETEFRIETSHAEGPAEVFFSPDLATCDACVAELFDPADRRFRYPFLNCTHCGPRLTIVRQAPYDRDRTTMAGFAMCPACRAEYDDPGDRRFHAQPTACPSCGPRLLLVGQAFSLPEDGRLKACPTAVIGRAAAALLGGRIVAVKGLGGYHLACDARNAVAVAELRRRKHRDEKPFAIMVADLSDARRYVEVSADEAALLSSPRRPIVLLRTKPQTAIAEAVAPSNPYLGIMLPYTPLHHLLLRDLAGVPLVMTSGNRSDEPIAFRDDDARACLGSIADLFLIHDRPIHLRCDDSVTRIVGGAESPLRRSRGYAPEPISLPFACPGPMLAVGGQLKATFALGRGRNAFLSHHLGDLDQYEAYRAFVESVDHYEHLFEVQPQWIVHDLHPDYASTRYALERERRGVKLLAVQHHHAHVAAGMAEHGLTGPVLGVAFDGTGYGTDETVWGGEFLVAGYREFRRAAHLRPVPMPGGEQAIREPWRMALAHLLDAALPIKLLESRVNSFTLRGVERIMNARIGSPLTSSAGRLFDAVACLAGIRDRVSYEGQAAIELEGLAATPIQGGRYPFDLTPEGEALVVDTRPLIAAAADDAARLEPPPIIARKFHSTIVDIVVAVCCRLREQTGLAEVVLTGGVFCNALLTVEATERLQADGFRVYRHRRVPPNDGGLSLGQLAVAAAMLS